MSVRIIILDGIRYSWFATKATFHKLWFYQWMTNSEKFFFDSSCIWCTAVCGALKKRKSDQMCTSTKTFFYSIQYHTDSLVKILVFLSRPFGS